MYSDRKQKQLFWQLSVKFYDDGRRERGSSEASESVKPRGSSSAPMFFPYFQYPGCSLLTFILFFFCGDVARYSDV